MRSSPARRVQHVIVLLCLLFSPASIALAGPAEQGADPARCHWIGRATKPAERLSSTQFVLTMDVERVVGATQPPDGDASILVNSINPRIPVSFYNNDRTKKYKIIVEGVTTAGKLIWLEKVITGR